MADFYPLIANTSAGQIQEIPSTANLNLSGCNVINTGTYYGSGAGLTNIPAGNISGTVATATTAGTVTTNAQPNITSVGTLSSLDVTANIAGGNVTTSGVFAGSGAQLTNIPGGNVSGTVATATTAGTVTTAAQPNITSVGIISSLAVTGNITSGNLSGTSIVGTLTTAAQTNITSVGALNGGSITSGFGAIDIGTDTVTCGGIVNSNANGVGNIGSSTTYFNTVFAKATSAQYADLAEMYVADANYQPGTVLEFGGNQEVTATAQSHSTRVAGIVSTNPSYLMNATQAGEYVVAVALTGRVPCRVQGPVRKGDVLVSSDTPGVAQRIGVNWQPGCTVGKAMEVIETSDIQVIEVAVGRL